MHKFYLRRLKALIWSFLLLGLVTQLQAQTFAKSDLDLNGNAFNIGVTSLMYGPDGRLYVAEYPTGLIKIFTVQRNNATDYEVTAVEMVNGIQTMADHNDDGTVHSSTNRQVTGLTVAGTAGNPIIYVSSSDVRIGSGEGGGNGDVGLDTNSGVITKLTWNGGSWDVVDLVRGLPRSEENHATNGLELTTINGTDYLLVASGGFTNAGSPSTNFVYTCEYALSGAVLSINLDAIDALPPLSDGGRSYKYDLPTLDDPSRANANSITDPNAPGYDGIDVNDPFGGNDGLNQVQDSTKISPDNWNLDLQHLTKLENDKIQLAMFYSYRTNVPLYPEWQQYFREHQPPTLIVWGKNDYIFPAEGAHPYKKDLKNLEFHLLDTGHFALEEKGEEIADYILNFLDKNNIK